MISYNASVTSLLIKGGTVAIALVAACFGLLLICTGIWYLLDNAISLWYQYQANKSIKKALDSMDLRIMDDEIINT